MESALGREMLVGIVTVTKHWVTNWTKTIMRDDQVKDHACMLRTTLDDDTIKEGYISYIKQSKEPDKYSREINSKQKQ